MPRGLALAGLVLALGACSLPVDDFVVVSGDAYSSEGGDASDAPTTEVPTDGGSAPPSCAPPTPDLCGSVCTDLARDRRNCGSCGHACPPGTTCSDGKCRGG